MQGIKESSLRITSVCTLTTYVEGKFGRYNYLGDDFAYMIVLNLLLIISRIMPESKENVITELMWGVKEKEFWT